MMATSYDPGTGCNSHLAVANDVALLKLRFKNLDRDQMAVVAELRKVAEDMTVERKNIAIASEQLRTKIDALMIRLERLPCVKTGRSVRRPAPATTRRYSARRCK